MVRIEESFENREITMDPGGNVTGMTVTFLAFGAASEEEATRAVLESVADGLDGLKPEGAEILERVNDTTYRVGVEFVSPSGSGGGDSGGGGADPVSHFEFSTGGGTMTRFQSLKTVGRYPAGAPDFGGAIGVDAEGNIAGVSVTMPVLNFTEKHTFPASSMTTAFKRRLMSMTGRVNSARFRGFEAGEVLFLGAEGGHDRGEACEITFKFATSPNKSDFKVGEIEVKKKKGWEYLWARYADKENTEGTAIIKSPTAVYVEQVYEVGDFGELGIGV